MLRPRASAALSSQLAHSDRLRLCGGCLARSLARAAPVLQVSLRSPAEPAGLPPPHLPADYRSLLSSLPTAPHPAAAERPPPVVPPPPVVLPDCQEALVPLSVPILPVSLTQVEGSLQDFAQLQGRLIDLTENAQAAAEAVHHAHRNLRAAGLLAPHAAPQLRAAVAAYLRDGTGAAASIGTSAVADQVLAALATLDVHLLAGPGILLEDVPDEVMERWSRDPAVLIDAEQLSEVRRQLYGASRFPIPVNAEAAGCCPTTLRRRQLVVERETQSAALKEYILRQDKMAEANRGSASGQRMRIWLDWVKDMTDIIEDMRSGKRKIAGLGSRAMEKVRDEVPLSADILAAITCQTVLNMVLIPSYRRKDELKLASAANPSEDGLGDLKVAFTTVTVAVGDAVELESSFRDHLSHSRSADKSPFSSRALAAMRHMSRTGYRSTDHDRKTHIVPIGSALVDLLLEVATVEVQKPRAEKEGLVVGTSAASSSGGSVGRTRVQAFWHGLEREGKKTVGYLGLQKVAQDQLLLSGADLLRFIAPKHQPMVIEPRPWRPSGEHPEGAYLMHRVPFIRTNSPNLTGLRSYCPKKVASVMDALGRTPWKINPKLLEIMTEAHRLDLGIAAIPAQKDPEVPNLDQIKDPNLTEAERKQLRIRHHNAVRAARELQSERPTFGLKIRVARDFLHAERLFFPHNVDFRGRAYPVPPHLNHIGDDVCRGLLMFADAKPLGKEGLFWLQVNLANLFGKNKIPFEERVAFVQAHREQILAAAEDPLAPDSIAFWTKADDGPWQALARCIELKEVWACEDPSKYESRLPIHLDGSCNGLQHYAALGRDEWGAKAVNLLPSERPQDVYSVVLDIVKKKVEAQAEVEEPEESEVPADLDDERPTKRKAKSQTKMARQLLLLGVLQRKVVKQTIMTICYGVTTVGARQQVLGQLEDMVGTTVEHAELKDLATYLSGLVLRSIDEVFERAMKIKKWFDSISKVFSQHEVPTTWLSPIGLACVQPYKDGAKVQVITKRQRITLQEEDGPQVHKMKQRMGFPPNFIHSLDATHMMLVAEACQREGVLFAGVHDSFWTHACDAPALNRIIREAFIELHERPTLDEFLLDAQLHLGAAAPLPPVPKQGTLDIRKVRDSLYIFN